MTLKSATRWRLLLSEPFPGVENMALDEALLLRARRTGETVLRVYSWSEPTLSLGRHQRSRAACDPDRAREFGIGVVRRITGGRALLHHREVTYSVTAPIHDGEALRVTYDRINELLLMGLRLLGVPAAITNDMPGRMPPPGGAPCFELPARGEIVVGARKLVGSAQLREDGALLQHGSILVEDDQALVNMLAGGQTAPVTPAATLQQALGRTPYVSDVAEALFAAVRANRDPSASAWSIDAATTADWERAKERYASEVWTWSR